MTQAPQDETTLIQRIDRALARGDTDTALALGAAAVDQHHDSPAFARTYAAALSRAGRIEAARDLLSPPHKARPRHTGLALDLAALLRRLDDMDGADRIFQHILDQEPGNEWARGGIIQLCLDRGDLEGALARSGTALAAQPDSVVLRRKRAAALSRAGRADEARALLHALHEERPQDSGIALDYAATLRSLGDLAGAGAVFDRVLQTHPGNDWALAGSIQIMLDRNAPNAALARCEAALADRPGSLALRRKKAAALRRTGASDAACDLLARLHAERPEDSGIALELAVVQRGLGDLEEAEAILRDVLRRDPRSSAARLALASTAEAKGEVDTALAILAEETAPPHAVTRLELLLSAGRRDAAQALVPGIVSQGALLSDDDLSRMIRILDRMDARDAVGAVTAHILQRQAITAHLAMTALRSVHMTGDRAATIEMEARLAPRVAPEKRAIFRADAALLLEGPFVALARLRAARTAQRDPMQAAVLGRVLLACGQTRLALRYLLRCAAHWPNTRAIRSNLVAAFLATGQPDRARNWLEKHSDRIDRAEMLELRLQVAMETGALETAVDLFDQLVRCGRRRRGANPHLRALLALGRLDAAETLAAHARRDPLLAPTQAAHFSLSQIGGILTELRLYQIAAPDMAAPGSAAALVATNFHAAQRALDSRADSPAAAQPPAKQPIPRRILQYWDSPDLPPDIIRVMDSWRGRPGWSHVILDRPGARRWLADTLGADHARAFDLAHNAAEESDFLRLCLLLAGGGIYADADDLLTGRPEELVQEGAGLIVFREPFGAIANNVICAPPGHPALHMAATMAKDALLRRDNDSTWLKTGPGLLTRAVACHLTRAEDDSATTILPQWRLLRHVKPHVPFAYKQTARYWNGHNAPSPEPRRKASKARAASVQRM